MFSYTAAIFQKVTEYYQFKIHYTAEGAQMDFESKNDNQVSAMSCGNTKKASILLVRKLYTLMQNLGPLPDNVYLNMKLAYYDDVTPQDYQPPGFKEADGDTLVFEKEPVKLTMGEVVTPFHTLKLDMATERRRLEEVEERVQASGKWVLQMEEEGVLSQAHVIEDAERPDNEDLDLDCSELQMSCYKKSESCEKAVEMDTEEKKSPIAEGLRRTRSGRIIRSTTETQLMVNTKALSALKDKSVSQFEIPDSQETASTSAPEKRRKFSEPREHF
uniref:HORMA domain containing 1 n=1 Tax=Cyclopterus lumpus TaxID=8103 RepID=A0A8C2X5H7_CYCLU